MNPLYIYIYIGLTFVSLLPLICNKNYIPWFVIEKNVDCICKMYIYILYNIRPAVFTKMCVFSPSWSLLYLIYIYSIQFIPLTAFTETNLNPVQFLQLRLSRAWSRINPLMPNGKFNICCPRDAVSRTANVEHTARH